MVLGAPLVRNQRPCFGPASALTSAAVPGLLAFHAHPDDESLSMGGTLARYADAGEHVVVVTASRRVRGRTARLPGFGNDGHRRQ